SERRDCEQFDDNCQGPTQENDIPADENYSNETSSDENIIDKTSSDQNLFDGTPSDDKRFMQEHLQMKRFMKEHLQMKKFIHPINSDGIPPENDNKDESPADPIRCPVGQYSGLYNLCQECPGMNEMCFTQNCCSPNTDLFCSFDGYCRCRPDQRDYW
ncbi:unnamed protein product, partial [Timema podura]|nr:unnamed protein product [Timema podura]